MYRVLAQQNWKSPINTIKVHNTNTVHSHKKGLEH